MKIIYNKILPFKGFTAINLFGVMFVRHQNRSRITAETINHEQIHTRQMKEMLYLFFYLWYFIEWLIRLIIGNDAYRNISFEREAYANAEDKNYLQKRKFWTFWRYITSNTKGGRRM